MSAAPTVPFEFQPDADQFRVWLDSALAKLNLKPGTAARLAKLPTNSIKKFLSGDNREIHVGTAAKIHAFLLVKAKEEGVTLPECRCDQSTETREAEG
ncbi:hypothetical protein TRP8649_01372 [Pelagimonas phthalicica]|uniref:XRE family transcriptional regulator n=1 Tax=Pelagimonas phthalicica TaxID=1037362 RepID=A0A238J9K5_9RHOB|nr:hypothetical protein [Pelagimonas phthalicica]TDS94206.1 hypothetical protein CLV87_0700 [Pelagimonas phthalicica]SMX27269.1 hypothetical protein TRP8649_01372 [Pelagimonas phthalicica]